MAELMVNIAEQPANYPLKIKKGLLSHLGKEIQTIYPNKKIAVVTDENVYALYGEDVQHDLTEAGFSVKMIILEPGEQTKSIDQLTYLYGEFIDFGLTRSDLMVALGGGVIGDLAGYAAASYLRGIRYVQVPTTLLAQVDSSVGGKVAIDLPQGKNLVGDFYHPELVIIDPNVLDTLRDTTFSDGMAEVIKYGCIRDKDFFNRLKKLNSRQAIMDNIEDIIYTCCDIKRIVVEEDEKDVSQRMLLNFGHTLGHAIEAYYNYEQYTHGQAISIGMVAINKICEEQGLSPRQSTQDIEDLLNINHLPTHLFNPSDYTEILPLIKNDKKNLDGSLKVVILEELGSARTIEVTVDFFNPVLKGDS